MPEIIKNIRLYSVKEVAVICGVHENTIRHRIDHGELPIITVSKNIFVEHNDLLKHILSFLNLPDPEAIIQHRLADHGRKKSEVNNAR